MRATSSRRTERPAVSLITMRARSSTEVTRPSTRKVTREGPDSTTPPGVVRFCDASARCTSAEVIFTARSLGVSSHTFTWRFLPPMMVTLPTPEMLSICRRTFLSAISVASRRLALECSAMRSTGLADGSTRVTTGASMPLGRSGRTPLTLSRTSCAATSVFLSSLKEMTTWEMPSADVEFRSSMPEMVLTAPSILSVTSLSTSSGAAPGSVVVTTTMGISTLGNWSTPRRL